VRVLGISGAATVAAIAAAGAAEQNCGQYAALERLPDRFEEIGRGHLANIATELVVLTDGTCTCDSTPAVSRALRKPAPQGINWSCRVATPDERRSD
jgi:homoserine kinase